MAEVATAVVTATNLLLKVTKLLIQEADFLKGVKEQIEQLKMDLEWMVLEVEEASENKSDNKRSHLYANQMRDITIDAEDVIEKFIINIVNHKRRSLHLSTMRFRHGLGTRVGEINGSVQKLRERKTAHYGIESSNRHSSSLQQQIRARRAQIFNEIRCQQEPVQMYESSARQVINLLMGDERDDGGMKLSIISIIGMGGVGKTTLSQKVFNDDLVKEKFECRVFIYLSKECSSQEVLLSKKKQLLQSIKNRSCGPVNGCEEVSRDGPRRGPLALWPVTIIFARIFHFCAWIWLLVRVNIGLMCDPPNSADQDEVDREIKTRLQDQKYLIVLDDIWDTDAWDKFKGAFPDAKNGSRVLLTTRHKRVALKADISSSNNRIHELSALKDTKESWELFLQNYLPFRSSSNTYEMAELSSDLVKLGNTMVDKCHGLPLAIVVLGGVLSFQVKGSPERSVYSVWSFENDRSGWLSGQDNESYSRCPGILALSYDCLPYHLKPCFLYMSLFPNNSMIRVTKLIQYWIAERLIISTTDIETMEAVAEAYLEDLISRSLIQVSTRRCDGRVKTCHIHGLLHSISSSESTSNEFSQTYGSIAEFNEKQNSSRRVAVYCKEQQQQNEQYVSKSHNLRIRSLMCHENVRYPDYKRLISFFGGFKCLRVLEFHGETGIVSLPEQVGELVHLRYLSLEKTKLKKINTSYLSKLVYLKTLNLRGDNEVVLDDQIWCLDQLRHLYLRNIRPAGRRKGTGTYPKNLQLLIIQAGDWINDGGLENLSSLRKLKIEECSFSHSGEISTAVANLTNLRSLALISKTSVDKPVINEQVPLASIQFSNHTRLMSLHLKGQILVWPRYISSFPPQLCKLKLEWSWITEDPMFILGELSSLRFLHLGFESYTGMQMVCSKGSFVSLQTLELVSISTAEEWIIEEGALASLTRLKISDCQRLKMIPDGLQQLTALQELRVANMPHLRRRMARNLGEDWHKIQHISSMEILV